MRYNSLIKTPAAVVTFILLATFSSLPASAADDESDSYGTVLHASPYVYQRSGQGYDMSVSLMYELGYGSRESRNFSQEGIENGLRARFQPWSFLGIEGFGGIVVDGDGGGYKSEAASIDIIARPLSQDRYYVNLDLGAGYIYDYRNDHIPRIRLAIGHSFNRLDLSLSGLLEVPVGSAGRDEADIMTALALSYAFADEFRGGLEVAGEDLEGLFESEEAEGGAKILFGPTADFYLPMDFILKFNAAAVYAYTSNQKYAQPGTTEAADNAGEEESVSPVKKPDEWGFMGRMVIGWTWH